MNLYHVNVSRQFSTILHNCSHFVHPSQEENKGLLKMADAVHATECAGAIESSGEATNVEQAAEDANSLTQVKESEIVQVCFDWRFCTHTSRNLSMIVYDDIIS